MGKIIYGSKFYLGESISPEKLDKIKKKLEKKAALTDYYLIALAGNETDLLDIYQSKYLGQKYYEDHMPQIYGIADTKGEAMELVQRIVEECLAERGDLKVREFLMEK